MKLSPVALEIDRRELTNRVNYDAVCTYQVSGTTAHRPTREQLMAYVRLRDMLVITELSRMSRSLAH